MELAVLERLVLLNVLPKEGNFTTLRLVRKLREALSFDELEHKKLDFIQDGEQVRWNMEAGKDVVKNFNIGERMIDLVAAELKKMDKEEKLRDEHFSLYEKFVEQPPKVSPIKAVPDKPVEEKDKA